MASSLVFVALLLAPVLAGPAPAPESSTACPANVKAVTAGPSAAGKGTYTNKYDNLNVDMLLRNERLLKNYIDCLMDRKPCSREGQLLKGELGSEVEHAQQVLKCSTNTKILKIELCN